MLAEIKPGVLSDVSSLEEWKDRVLTRDGGKCVNCDISGKVTACFIIPPEVGGKLRMSNGATICRECRIAAEGARVLPSRIDNKTPINFFVSAKLHETVVDYAKNGTNFGSVSAVVRQMVSSFVSNPELFEDLSLWQDTDSEATSVKVNGWIDGDLYDRFKTLCHDRGLTYTSALKGLLLVAVDGYELKKENG